MRFVPARRKMVTAAGGILFALRMPMVHLDGFRQAFHHGEMLRMVEVARDRVLAVEELIHRRYPEVLTGGSGWTPDAFGVQEEPCRVTLHHIPT